MLPFGVVTASAYRPAPPDASRLARALLNTRRVALRLLRTDMPPTPAQLALFEGVMRGLRLRSGIYRTTYRNRFLRLDPFVNELLQSRFPPDTALHAEDWAASDCLTSAEWAGSLLQLFPHATLVASDLTLYLIEVLQPDGSAFVMEADGRGLQYVKGACVVSLYPPEPNLALVSRIMARRAERRLEALKVALPDEWLDSDLESFRSESLVLQKIPLTHPEARMLALKQPRFSIVSRSAFEPSPQQVEVVRTMNIFNRGYFDTEKLREGISAVWRSLVPGGVWIIGRTVEKPVSETNASLLERTSSGFRVLSRYGSGSEIEELATGWQPPGMVWPAPGRMGPSPT